jgi:nucleotide-binding universal stress UspA family protein
LDAEERVMKSHYVAAEEFYRARSRASFQELLARLTRHPVDLFSYEEVRQKLRVSGVASQSIRDVPLDAILGSVGRYTDFTRSFLPRRTSDRERWVRIMVATNDASGLPPVDLYLIDEVYFVSDGHHRVSVAREVGASTIQAYVTEIRSEVPLSADDRRADLILKAEYADFLSQTQITASYPNADLTVSTTGQYGKLLDHISVHRYFLGIDLEREVSYDEAVAHWYDTIFLPVILIVRDLGILRDFPQRTEADLYLWISHHRAEIAEAINWDVDFESAAVDLAAQKGPRWRRIVARLGRSVIDVVSPEGYASTMDQTRPYYVKQPAPESRRLFNDILVPVSGLEVGWIALDQALDVATREGSRILGLHVSAGEDEVEVQRQGMEDGFDWRCGEKGIQGVLSFAEGSISRTICERARWTDLVVVKLLYPPGSSALERYSSGLARMIRGCARPILVVAGDVSSLYKPLLVWEDNDKSNLALMVAAYVAGQWKLPIVVLACDDSSPQSPEKIEKLRDYLVEFDLEVAYISGKTGSPDEILSIADERKCDWVITGGYDRSALREIVAGTPLDELLGRSTIPILICQ